MESYWKYTIAAFIGVMLFAFDFELFLASIPGLIGLFGFSLNDINLINDIAFAISAIAAFSFGAMADRFGRKLLFMITILIYAFGSFLTGLSSTVLSFIGARGITSVGTGPDEPLGFTLTAETAPAKARGRQMMVTSLGFPIGQAIGAAVVYLFVLHSVYLPYVFFIGVIPALFLLYLRKGLPETDRFTDLKAAREKVEKEKVSNVETKYKANLQEAVKNPYKQLFDLDLRRKSILMAIYTAIVAGNVAISLIALPIYYTSVKHVSFASTLSFEFISFALAAVGYVVVAYVGNRIGRRNIILAFLFVTVFSIFGIIYSTTPTEVLVFNVIFIFFLFSQWAAWPFYLNEMFPTRVRATASNFGYAFQWIGNIIFPTSILSIVTIYTGNWELAIILTMIVPIAFAFFLTALLPRDNPTAVLEANAI
jgi:MFS family permease